MNFGCKFWVGWLIVMVVTVKVMMMAVMIPSMASEI